eukprot:CAMPEP_0167757542 /NCGR_PEP_ID=MMETSP0110_2-20121227/9981_1 /TAXON_ID=629695 /ORGANISM="Gymnochlora sp., Strain CCMP2014" /LENGTH=754 /DNA_ID=CAMNT_0007643739 /DNA_START=44 /DNA_END=2308 /DNA_ORIENTATION=+
MREEIKKRERTEKEQRKIDGSYCILERRLTESEKLRKSILEAKIPESEPASKSDIHNDATETDSMAEPIISAITSNENSISEVKSSRLDSEADSDTEEMEYWDDESDPETTSFKGEEMEEKEKKEIEPSEVALNQDFVIGVKGAIFGSDSKVVNNGKGFRLPSPASPRHFQITYESKNFFCEALDVASPVRIEKRRHEICEGNEVEFSNGARIAFRKIYESESKNNAMGVTVELQPEPSATVVERTWEISSSSSICADKGVISITKEKSLRFGFAELIIESPNGLPKLILKSNVFFSLCLSPKENCVPKAKLCTEDMIYLAEDERFRFKVAICQYPRHKIRKDTTSQSNVVTQHASAEEPNLTFSKEHQDRVSTCVDILGDGNDALFCVFDGHGGRDVADVAAASAPVFIGQELKNIRQANCQKVKLHTRSATEYSSLAMGQHHTRGKTLTAIQTMSELATIFAEEGKSPTTNVSTRGGIALSACLGLSRSRSISQSTSPPVRFFDASDITRGPSLALKRACSRISNLMHGLVSEMGSYQGSTGQLCLLHRDSKTNVITLHSASVGDSGAILVRDGKPVEVSVICRHKPDHKDEQARIEKAGGRVSDGRLMNMLAVSRAFGDVLMIDWGLISEPHFSETEIGPGDSHLIVASDGVWDYMSSKRLADIVSRANSTEEACEQIVNILTHGSVSRLSKDNISIIIVELKYKSKNEMEESKNPLKFRSPGKLLFPLKEARMKTSHQHKKHMSLASAGL